MSDYRWGKPRVSTELRKQILDYYLDDPAAGTRLAMDNGLTAAYAYKLAHERGLVPRSGKHWGQLREALL